MSRRTFFAIVAVATMVLLAGADVIAQSQSSRARYGTDNRKVSARTGAVAVVEPSDDAQQAWGRIQVTDWTHSDQGVWRHVAAHLFDLDPGEIYTISVDGVVLGAVTTDDQGDAMLALSSTDPDLDPVPDLLPPAGELVLALVEDAAQETILQGVFEIRSYGGQGFQGLVYYDRIRLEPTADARDARGLARVARNEYDEQWLETRACGLLVGAVYQVFVDDQLAGTVTTDAVGHGVLTLTTGDDDNPWPDALTSIENLVRVEWKDGDTVVLTGSFTGENLMGGGGPQRRGNGSGVNGPHDGDGLGGGSGGNDANGGHGDCDGSGPDDRHGGHYGGRNGPS